jgi:3-phosphoshikimate 1-carboxyvinyltransferase
MELTSESAVLSGTVRIPASKSHTIRGLLIAALADGVSTLRNPLASGDTGSCVHACRAFGAQVDCAEDAWSVTGVGGCPDPPANVIDVGNSGTTLYLALGVAALSYGWSVFTGDYQIRRRSAQPLMDALEELGATVFATRGTGCAPLVIRGPLKGGSTTIECPTSQYLSALLLSCPLAQGDSEIFVPLLNEQPYAEMTLDWLAQQKIKATNYDFKHFQLHGRQRYTAFDRDIPGDFSSATFFLVAAAVTGSEITLNGLDMHDSQGDKAVVDMLGEMGVKIETGPDYVRVCGGELHGAELDLNATPDALPALAVAGCFAKGETRLVNVPQARMKETDRITVMQRELSALGADCEELPSGLVVRESTLSGGKVHGYDDHRVVMAMAVAGLRALGPVMVDSAEAMRITFPSFVDLMTALGARMTLEGK